MERFVFAATLFVIALAGVLAATSNGGVLGLSGLTPPLVSRAEGITAFSR